MLTLSIVKNKFNAFEIHRIIFYACLELIKNNLRTKKEFKNQLKVQEGWSDDGSIRSLDGNR